MADWKNKLYYGDNLQVLREYVADESVDLIYFGSLNPRHGYSVVLANLVDKNF